MAVAARTSTIAAITGVVCVLVIGIGIAGAVADPGQVDRTNGTEDPYVEAVPGEGDRWFEARASDDSWISYINPRDEYRSPYAGSGSGKICVTLVNEDGEVIVGESIPDTRVTIATTEALDWHSSAGPIVVEFPLTEHYDRPLDADQFGTDPDLPQGDGYLDSHCIEWHGMPEDAQITYEEAQIEGEYADSVEVVGYHQQPHAAWDSDIDPIADAVDYEETDGGWYYLPDRSHGQAVVVLQLSDEIVRSSNGDEPDRESINWSDVLPPENQSTDQSGTDDRDGGDHDRDSNETAIDGGGILQPLYGFTIGLAIISIIVGVKLYSRT